MSTKLAAWRLADLFSLLTLNPPNSSLPIIGEPSENLHIAEAIVLVSSHKATISQVSDIMDCDLPAAPAPKVRVPPKASSTHDERFHACRSLSVVASQIGDTRQRVGLVPPARTNLQFHCTM